MTGVQAVLVGRVTVCATCLHHVRLSDDVCPTCGDALVWSTTKDVFVDQSPHYPTEPLTGKPYRPWGTVLAELVARGFAEDEEVKAWEIAMQKRRQ